MAFVWKVVGGWNWWKDPLIKRAKIPGGWLVWCDGGLKGGLTFVPDPNHEWDGNSLPL